MVISGFSPGGIAPPGRGDVAALLEFRACSVVEVLEVQAVLVIEFVHEVCIGGPVQPLGKEGAELLLGWRELKRLVIPVHREPDNLTSEEVVIVSPVPLLPPLTENAAEVVVVVDAEHLLEHRAGADDLVKDEVLENLIRLGILPEFESLAKHIEARGLDGKRIVVVDLLVGSLGVGAYCLRRGRKGVILFHNNMGISYV